ncbi:MAG: hypothetical protein AWM53_02062 [Candidatus Dichloromethanomonas elyunquensis]|nr:MAG: hypothetical protein AWM53_02062 [Candidatus Dichloromethanomonas elyunquensis]
MRSAAVCARMAQSAESAYPLQRPTRIKKIDAIIGPIFKTIYEMFERGLHNGQILNQIHDSSHDRPG